MSFRLHPILLPFFIFLIATGGISTYVLFFSSLLWHELGHLVAARFVRMKVRTCTIYPYGGELTITNYYATTKRARIIVALGGPVATLLLYCLASILPFAGMEQWQFMQLVLFGVNCLPILPLDGGQVVATAIETQTNRFAVRSFFLLYSIVMLFIMIIFLSSSLPQTLPYIAIASFLLLQNVAVFRYRKYARAFELITSKHLTP